MGHGHLVDNSILFSMEQLFLSSVFKRPIITLKCMQRIEIKQGHALKTGWRDYLMKRSTPNLMSAVSWANVDGFKKIQNHGGSF